jgi:hypothetical protein
MTKHLRELYGIYNVEQQTSGLQALEWPLWLQQNGYQLAADGLVTPIANQDVDKLILRNSYQ